MSRRKTALLTASLLLAMGCGRQSDPPAVMSSQSLLTRHPDFATPSMSVLAPDAALQWGSAASGPWWTWTGKAYGDRPATVGSPGPRAGVWIEAGAVRDRDLRLFLKGPAGSESAPLTVEVRVYLNGIKVGAQDVSKQGQWVEFETIAANWREGRNLVELETDQSYKTSSRNRVAFWLGTVDAGQEGSTLRDPATGQLELIGNAFASYLVALDETKSLELRAMSQPGAGELVVSATSVARDGSTSAKRALALEVFEPLSSGRIEESIEIDAPLGTLAELKLHWQPRAENASLEFESLALTGGLGMPQPPVILIAVDTLSARHLSTYGYPRDTSPELSEFAARSVVFERCYSNAPWTLPSFLTMHSGLLPRTHLYKKDGEKPGARLSITENSALDPRRWTLAEAFRSAGWHTSAFVDNLWITSRFRFDQGYDHYTVDAAKVPLLDRTGGISLVSEKFLEWQATLPNDSPYFAFLHCFDVHGPYAPAPEWIERVTQKPTPLDLPDSFPAGGLGAAYGSIPSYVLDPETRDSAPEVLDPSPLVDAYDGGIAEVDHKLGLLFDELERRGEFERSIIVVTSDHGESLIGHNRLFGHTQGFLDTLHVPLIVHFPNDEYAGKRVTERVQTVDLFPTLLDSAGLYFDESRLHGQSVVPMLEGESLGSRVLWSEEGSIFQASIQRDGWHLLIFDYSGGDVAARLTYPGLDSDWVAEHVPEIANKALTSERLAAIKQRLGGNTGIEQMIRSTHPGLIVQLFNTDEDPDELIDLAEKQPSIVAKLLADLVKINTTIESRRLKAPGVAEVQDFSDEELEALRAAGYLEEE